MKILDSKGITTTIFVVGLVVAIIIASGISLGLASILGLKGEKGDAGPAGATGATGATGPQGPAGPTLIKFATNVFGTSLTTTYAKLVEISLTSPANGYVHVVATATVYCQGDKTMVVFGVGNSTTGGSYPDQLTITNAGPNTLSSGTYFMAWSVNSQGVFAVQKGVTYTFFASAADTYIGATTPPIIDHIYLVAEFFGTQPLN